MPERKSYGQFCGLARALDHVGDRWTLLVVRELLLGPKTFRDLELVLDGIGPALLTTRINRLMTDGLVDRNDAPARSKAVIYTLTADGKALEPVVLELIRWGRRWMANGPGTDTIDPRWTPLALRALLEGHPSNIDGTVHVDVSDTWTTVTSRSGHRQVALGRHGSADATVTATLADLLAVAAGQARLNSTDAVITGSRRCAKALLQTQQI
jgi:DNA-binding HxlR family transcriptional regulator